MINRELERDEEELEAQSPFEFKVRKRWCSYKICRRKLQRRICSGIYVVVGLKKSVEGTMASVYPIYLVPYQEETSTPKTKKK